MNRSDLIIERHDTGPPEAWRPSLDNARLLRRTILERRPRPSDGMELLVCDRDRAAILSIVDAPPLDIAQAIAMGAGAGAAGAMVQAARDGAVLLREPDSDGPRTIPVGDAGMNPLLWRDALMLALIARDASAVSVLRNPLRIAACQMAPDRADAFWPDYCAALAAAVGGSENAGEQLDAALSAIQEVRIADRAAIEAVDRPLLLLTRLLVRRSSMHWDAAVSDALQCHRRYFGTDDRHYDRTGVLALGVLGVCALAYDTGIGTGVVSPYIPGFLVDGTVRGALSIVARAPGGSRPVAEEAADMALALVAAEALKQIARPVLELLRGPDPARAAAGLWPRAADYAAVFVGAAVETARHEYEQFWCNPPSFPRAGPMRTELQIHLAPAGMLSDDNALSRSFPLGYRAIAHWLNPHRIWAAWRFVQPGGSGGLAYNGLVWCDDHWAWFPRPYQVLGRLLK